MNGTISSSPNDMLSKEATPQGAGAPLLEVENLTVSFSSPAGVNTVVKGVSFAVKKGEIFCLVGESGSGKSMTAAGVMRLMPSVAGRIDAGRVIFEGRDLLRMAEHEMRAVRGAKMGMIFQEPMTSLNPVMTIGEQLREVYTEHLGLKSDEARERSIQLLQSIGLPQPEERLAWYSHQLSGGQRQRVIIAMALACNPQLLIADEPTTALDVTIQAQVLELLRKLRKERDLAILLITHDLGVVAEMADRVAVMKEGEIVEQATCQDFFVRPQAPYSRELLQSMPSEEFKNRQGNDSLEEILRVEGLSVAFGIRKGLLQRRVGEVRAVDNVSLQIKKGQTLAVVGESGSGKTTLGRAILRLIKVDRGQVHFRGTELVSLSARQMRQVRKDIQVVFQDPFSSLNPRMRVGEIIAEGVKALGLAHKQRDLTKRVEDVLQQVGLNPEYRLRFPHQFSGGQRQRICIARALAVEPRLIICDEITSALDVSVRARLLALLQDLQDSLGVSYLFITHDLSLVPSIADEIAVMREGRVVEYGPVVTVLTSPQTDYTRDLLRAVPRIRKGF